VKVAEDNGYQAMGIDADEWVINEGRKHHGCEVVAADPLEFEPGRTFDIITIIDVFEHFHNPHAYMVKLSSLLTADGMIVIEMPDADAPGFRRLGWDWKHFKPREHAFYYGLHHVLTLAAMHGFQVLHHFVPYPDRRTYYLERNRE
jgi:2-polyprenyl-3-methyl-5-hydroxy-6-metoxy-1,4-benzoquinol methylase